MPPRIAAAFDMYGPYHLARLNALGQQTPLLGVETSARSQTYAWDSTAAAATTFARHTLFADDALASARSYRETAARIDAALDHFAPDVLLVPGWASKAAVAMLRWGMAHNVPRVVMTESTARDNVRSAWKEAVKRNVIACFDAGFVGGGPQRAYLASLGMADERITVGYDVVDNGHFADGAAAARADGVAQRHRLGVPDRYFLASARFVPVKNLTRLIEAFAQVCRARPALGLHLVLLGDGPSRAGIEAQIAALGLGNRVILPGFKQYHELPAYYGLAEAFVHVSTVEPWGLVVNEAMSAGLPVIVSAACGCAQDLVSDGGNGYVVDATDVGAIASALIQLTDAPASARRAMAERSSMIIASWSLDRFASGALTASDIAQRCGPGHSGPGRRALLEMLSRWV